MRQRPKRERVIRIGRSGGFQIVQIKCRIERFKERSRVPLHGGTLPSLLPQCNGVLILFFCQFTLNKACRGGMQNFRVRVMLYQPECVSSPADSCMLVCTVVESHHLQPCREVIGMRRKLPL